ncbi:hypothetical protein K438DRAFT_2130619 [Mycena galopus ATCC 62051]|nr:hypothetical protein K438DRAFT_2130619 [Mycena galopus ATCC 62051]
MICTLFPFMVCHMYPPPSALLSSTPGFRVIIGNVWGFLAELDSGDLFDQALGFVTMFIGSLDFADPVDFAEIIDGVGGTLDDLADLALEFLDDVAVRARDGKLLLPEWHLRGLLRFITGASVNERDPMQNKLIERLQQCGFVAGLVVAMGYLLETPNADMQHACGEVLDLLSHFFLDVSLGYRSLEAAIEAGLLRVMTRIGSGLPDALQRLLTTILPGGMVYYYVIVEIAEDLVKLKEIWSDEQFKTLEIFDSWSTFIDLAERRVQLMERVDDIELFKACDNLKTARRRIGELADIAITVGPMQSCSVRFIDPSSSPLMPNWIAESDTCGLDFRERQFLRELIEEAYEKELYSIYRQQTNVMIRDPDGSPLTLFDYTIPAVKVSVHSVQSPPIGLDLQAAGSGWGDILARACRSHGRFQVHIMRVPEGRSTRFWAIPLRATDSKVHELIHQFAAKTIRHRGEFIQELEAIWVGDDHAWCAPRLTKFRPNENGIIPPEHLAGNQPRGLKQTHIYIQQKSGLIPSTYRSIYCTTSNLAKRRKGKRCGRPYNSIPTRVEQTKPKQGRGQRKLTIIPKIFGATAAPQLLLSFLRVLLEPVLLLLAATASQNKRHLVTRMRRSHDLGVVRVAHPLHVAVIGGDEQDVPRALARSVDRAHGGVRRGNGAGGG